MEKPGIKWEDIVSKDGFYITYVVPGSSLLSSTYFGMFFTAYWPCEVVGVSETHAVAGTDGGAVTLQLERLKPGVAAGAGEDILITAFDLKSTANTPVEQSGFDFVRTPSTVDGWQPRQLDAGDRIALKTSGTLTGLNYVLVTVYLQHLGRGDYR